MCAAAPAAADLPSPAYGATSIGGQNASPALALVTPLDAPIATAAGDGIVGHVRHQHLGHSGNSLVNSGSGPFTQSIGGRGSPSYPSDGCQRRHAFRDTAVVAVGMGRSDGGGPIVTPYSPSSSGSTPTSPAASLDGNCGASRQQQQRRTHVPAAAVAAPHQHRRRSTRPIFFSDSSLIDRYITAVHLNVAMFHQYARLRHPTAIAAEYAAFVTFLQREVRRFGGVLESFHGDKLWVSFNATSKCDHHQIAAAYFAFHVTTVANNAATLFLEQLAGGQQQQQQPEGGSSAAPQLSAPKAPPVSDPRFTLCRYGLNCGVATGRAFVGPLGNSSVKRHTIISNAMSEASALERLGLRFPGVNAVIGGDMIPAIEGYCQYILIDAVLLPGSNGKRRRVACLKGPMVAAGKDATVVRRWLVRKPPTTPFRDCGHLSGN